MFSSGVVVCDSVTRPLLKHISCGRDHRLVQVQRYRSARVAAKSQRTADASVQAATAATQKTFIKWLQSNGVSDMKLELHEVQQAGRMIDTLVAAQPLREGERVFRVPERLVVTLDRVFQDGTVAELLTDNKLSELACLTLYMMYEKKQGPKSFWYQYIKELDRQRGRGQQGATSALLWDKGQVQELLAGSHVVEQIADRIRGIEREYDELDTVWFMAGSLFKNYPYDIPTDAFSLELFKQAFAAVQASVVHLQGVPLSKRFALVPLGPPLLTYSSTAKNMLVFDKSSSSVLLSVDRQYSPGEAVRAWCGPQPNSRLLINYGIVDEDNPYDKLQVTATLPKNDPLFMLKRGLLAEAGLTTMQAFDLTRAQTLAPKVLPFIQVALAADEASARAVSFAPGAAPASLQVQQEAAALLLSYLRGRLARYRTSIEEDTAIINGSCGEPRRKVAAKLLRIEKQILTGAIEQLQALTGSDNSDAGVLASSNRIRLS